MKTFKNIILLFSGILLFHAPSFGQGIVIKQSNESGIYDAGENIKVSVQLHDIKADFLAVKIVKNNIQTIVDKRVEKPGKEAVIFNEGINDPVSLIFEVKTDYEFVALGAIVAPDKLYPGFKRPPDLDKYWDMEKRALRALPMEIKDIPVNDIDKGYICSNLEINCTGAKPVRGYFARPEKARPGSLPIVLFVHAAGVSGDWPDPFGSNGNREKMLKTLPYFDVASLLTGSNATIFTEIGLIDYTCPASSIYAALNQAKGKKITIGVPYRGHHLDQVSYQKKWEETVSGPKMDFILDILK